MGVTVTDTQYCTAAVIDLSTQPPAARLNTPRPMAVLRSFPWWKTGGIAAKLYHSQADTMRREEPAERPERERVATLDSAAFPSHVNQLTLRRRLVDVACLILHCPTRAAEQSSGAAQYASRGRSAHDI